MSEKKLANKALPNMLSNVTSLMATRLYYLCNIPIRTTFSGTKQTSQPSI